MRPGRNRLNNCFLSVDPVLVTDSIRNPCHLSTLYGSVTSTYSFPKPSSVDMYFIQQIREKHPIHSSVPTTSRPIPCSYGGKQQYPGSKEKLYQPQLEVKERSWEEIPSRVLKNNQGPGIHLSGRVLSMCRPLGLNPSTTKKKE